LAAKKVAKKSGINPLVEVCPRSLVEVCKLQPYIPHVFTVKNLSTGKIRHPPPFSKKKPQRLNQDSQDGRIFRILEIRKFWKL
jgi:hypothetical protein